MRSILLLLTVATLFASIFGQHWSQTGKDGLNTRRANVATATNKWSFERKVPGYIIDASVEGVIVDSRLKQILIRTGADFREKKQYLSTVSLEDGSISTHVYDTSCEGKGCPFIFDGSSNFVTLKQSKFVATGVVGDDDQGRIVYAIGIYDPTSGKLLGMTTSYAYIDHSSLVTDAVVIPGQSSEEQDVVYFLATNSQDPTYMKCYAFTVSSNGTVSSSPLWRSRNALMNHFDLSVDEKNHHIYAINTSYVFAMSAVDGSIVSSSDILPEGYAFHMFDNQKLAITNDIIYGTPRLWTGDTSSVIALSRESPRNKVLWNTHLPGPKDWMFDYAFCSPPAIDENTNTLLTTCCDTNTTISAVFALNAKTGAIQWQRTMFHSKRPSQASGECFSGALTKTGLFTIICKSFLEEHVKGLVYVLDVRTGEIRNKIDPGAIKIETLVDESDNLYICYDKYYDPGSVPATSCLKMNILEQATTMEITKKRS